MNKQRKTVFSFWGRRPTHILLIQIEYKVISLIRFSSLGQLETTRLKNRLCYSMWQEYGGQESQDIREDEGFYSLLNLI